MKTVFISSIEEMMDINNVLEKEADDFANNYLIPPTELSKFTWYSSRYCGRKIAA